MININNINPILSIIFGLLIIASPKLLSTLVGIYLILTGLLALGIIRF